jgi:hypothetical protein
MILYIENPKDSTKKKKTLLELVNLEKLQETKSICKNSPAYLYNSN